MASKSKETTAAPVIEVPQGTKPNKLKVKDIDLEVIEVRDKRDRTRDDAFRAGIRELAASMAAIGLRQPITLRAMPTDGEHCFLLIAGERRLEAAKLLGWSSIPAEVLDADAEAIDQDIRAAENLHREDLNEDQKALAIGDLVAAAEEIQARQQGVEGAAKIAALPAPARDAIRKAAIAAVAQRFGKPPQWVRDYAYIGGLPKKVRELVAAGRLSLAHAKVLAAVVDPQHCTDLAMMAAAAAGEGAAKQPMMALDDLRREVNATLNSLAKVPWDLNIAFAGKPACMGCSDNSRNRTGLFDGRGTEMGARGDRGCLTDINFAKDAEDCGVCLNMACFKAKASACKDVMRSAGNRIAAKVIEAKPKERAAVMGAAVNEANRKASFVKPTVFRKEVQERVESKTEKPKGAGKPMQRQSAEQSKRDRRNDEARRQHASAVRGRNEKLSGQFVAWVMKRDAADRALLFLAFESTVAQQVMNGGKKAAAALATFKSLVKAACDSGPITAFDLIAPKLAPECLKFLVDWRMKENVELVDFLVGMAGVKDLPPVPKLEDFLPKPAAKADEKKSKMSTPAKAAAGKKPSGKKRSKKSKPSGSASSDGPLPETEDAILNSRDDRGASDRRQAAKEMAADAAGEIDPQEEV